MSSAPQPVPGEVHDTTGEFPENEDASRNYWAVAEHQPANIEIQTFEQDHETGTQKTSLTAKAGDQNQEQSSP